jgi:hypothetical protein
MLRRRFKQLYSLKERLENEVTKLRQEADDTPPGVKRDLLLRRARHAEAAAHMDEWLNSPGLRAPQ